MNITIVGGGNIGTQFTVHFAEKFNNVVLYTSKPQNFQKRIDIVDSDNNVIHFTDNYIVTNSKKIAFSNADVILVTVPAFAMKRIAEDILPFVHKGFKIICVPGTGGVEWVFRKCINSGAELFGLQRVPSVARLLKYGSVVKCTGYRNNLYLGAISSKKSLDEICKLISSVFNIPCNPLPNYLSVTLTPSNPILHTSRLYSIFHDYKDGKIYDKQTLFYEDWTNSSSKILFAMDQELQVICKNLKEFDLKYVISLKQHYESNTIQQLTNKITSISSFKGLNTPMIQVQNGYAPDFTSRYFTADFPYGLAILVQIGDLLGTDCTTMKKVLSWYKKIQPDITCFNFKDYKILNRKDFIDSYSHKEGD